MTEWAPGESAAATHLPEAVLVNGHPAREVSALERGLHYGDGLFETIACLEGEPRFLDLHLERLAEGCARLRLAGPIAVIGREVRELAAGSERAVVKVIVTRGEARARGYGATGRERPTCITLRYAWPAESASAAGHGVRVRLASVCLGENPALAGLKHCNRLEQVLARGEWSDPDILDALMFSSSGALISGTMSNVFLGLEGKLLTPRLDRCGVAGVMRRVVLTAAAAAGICAEERRLGREELAQADELFLTNTLMGLRAVREIEGRTIAVGPLTQRLEARLAPLLNHGRDLAGA
jgi:4-amino-4-deoxychorismate lyase